MIDKLRIAGLGVLGALVVGAILLLAWEVHQEPAPVTPPAGAMRPPAVAAAPDAAVPEAQATEAQATEARTAVARAIATRAAEARAADEQARTRRGSRRAPPRAERSEPALMAEPEVAGPPSTDDVRHAYDRGDYITALEVAREVLAATPDNHYVRRAAAVSACALGERAEAREYHAAMNDRDKRVTAIRCGRFGLEL